MIILERSVLVAAPAERVWAVLREPDVVAACIPGLTVDGRTGSGGYRGRFSVSFGPTRVSFDGEADIEIDEEGRSGVIVATGLDRCGRTRARGDSRFRLLADPNGARLATRVSFEVNGPLAAFARTGGAQILRRLLDQMAANVAQLVAPAGAAAAEADRAAIRPRLGDRRQLLLRRLGSWVRGWWPRRRAAVAGPDHDDHDQHDDHDHGHPDQEEGVAHERRNHLG